MLLHKHPEQCACIACNLHCVMIVMSASRPSQALSKLCTTCNGRRWTDCTFLLLVATVAIAFLQELAVAVDADGNGRSRIHQVQYVASLQSFPKCLMDKAMQHYTI